MASYRKINFILLEVDGTHLAEAHEVADAFVKHFQSVYNSPCSGYSPPFYNFPNFYY
jgi:hypothetical protein